MCLIRITSTILKPWFYGYILYYVFDGYFLYTHVNLTIFIYCKAKHQLCVFSMVVLLARVCSCEGVDGFSSFRFLMDIWDRIWVCYHGNDTGSDYLHINGTPQVFIVMATIYLVKLLHLIKATFQTGLQWMAYIQAIHTLWFKFELLTIYPSLIN